MLFESFSQAHQALLLGAFGIALIMGAVVNKTNFCTMGAVSDAVNMGDWGRMRAWMFAIAIALLGVTGLEAVGLVQADGSFPPYRSGNLIWAENILGGLLFGIGMTLASGCGNKTLIRIGGGNLKSIVVFGVIGVIAYFMINPFPGSDQTLMSLLFLDWIRPLAVSLDGGQQDLGTIFAGSEGAGSARLWIGTGLGLLLLGFVFKSADFRGSFDNVLGGLVVGVAILGAWYVSSNIGLTFEDSFEGEMTVSVSEFLDPAQTHWDMNEGIHEGWDAKPASSDFNPQSYTFINPMGQSLGYAAGGFAKTALTFGVVAVLGVVAGSFIWAILSGGFRFEWFASVRDFMNHFIGAILMGFGGVLAMGCTIGQGITGFSTLAVGSMMALVSIVFGSALTMKIQYYQMVYEEEATFPKALVTALADMRLVPNAMRKLEAI